MDVGENVNFSCTSHHKQVHWYFENTHQHPMSYPFHFGPTYTIEHVKLEDAGSYFCHGAYSTSETYLSEAILVVYGRYFCIKVS